MGCGEQQVALSQHPQHSLPSGGFRVFLFSARTHSREKDSQWRCVAFFGPPLSPLLQTDHVPHAERILPVAVCWFKGRERGRERQQDRV